LIDADRYPFDKEASGPDASRVALEQEDAKVFFKRFDPCADA